MSPPTSRLRPSHRSVRQRIANQRLHCKKSPRVRLRRFASVSPGIQNRRKARRRASKNASTPENPDYLQIYSVKCGRADGVLSRRSRPGRNSAAYSTAFWMPAALKEAAKKRRRFIRDADDLVGGLAIE